ncbi:MAG: hypothetical protein LBR26_16930 [Prevotella sp.]|jgi:hypothetical protein|nr:hypothetical protein [Prevotella sp.]
MILFFNPGHETAVQNSSPYYTAPANVATMRQELSFLPAWYGVGSDLVLTDKKIDGKYHDFLLKNLPSLPKPVTKESLPCHPEAEVSLWGISPQAIHYFSEINKEYGTSLRLPEWNEAYIYLNSRQAARDCLTELAGNISGISGNISPVFYNRLEDIEEAVNNSSRQLLAKAPYSSSGRGLLWLPPTGLTRTERQIMHGILKKQGSVSIERALDKQTDFAMEFICDGQGDIEFAGYSLFYTSHKGAYLGNCLDSQEHIMYELAKGIPLHLLEETRLGLTAILKEKYSRVYKGCIGVDMLVYKEEEEYKVHPCLEINMRYNMGYLALKLFENHIDPLSHGHYHLDFSSKEGGIYNRHKQMETQYPATFKNGRLAKGYLPLCPVGFDSKYWAYAIVDARKNAYLQSLKKSSTILSSIPDSLAFRKSSLANRFSY